MLNLIRQPIRCLNCGRVFSDVDDDGCPCHDPENFHPDDTTAEATPVRVFDLASGEYVGTYTCSPTDAVTAAYAQSVGDWNTWDYRRRYGPMVVTGANVVRCGGFTAKRKDRR